MKRRGVIWAAVLAAALLAACAGKDADGEKLRDIDFTVATTDELPEEFLAQIDAAKEKEFRLSCTDQGYLYIAVGYGKQETSGYSIRVLECSETSETIRFRTELVGPAAGEKTVAADTWPWIAVKMEESDKTVVYP